MLNPASYKKKRIMLMNKRLLKKNEKEKKREENKKEKRNKNWVVHERSLGIFFFWLKEHKPKQKKKKAGTCAQCQNLPFLSKECHQTRCMCKFFY